MAQHTTSVDTIIIGAGQAGLAVSYCLTKGGHAHLLLEQAGEPAHAWRDERWDSFTLLTPNWSIRLPGAPYDGDTPDGFMPRNDLIAHFDRYVLSFRPPIRFGVRATAIGILEGPGAARYRIEAESTEREPLRFEAANVVVATGLFQRPKILAVAAALSPHVLQIPASAYRHVNALPNGAILVVGSAQSGCQIAEELYQSGRKVYLCVGSAGRLPRRYRGADIYLWLYRAGFFDRTPEQLPSSRARFAGNPHISGKDGGRTLNLHQFARDGVTLLGRLQDASEGTISLAPDLHDTLARVDKVEADICRLVDGYIARMGLDAPATELPELRDGFQQEIITDFDLRQAGVSAIIWALGYHFDFGMAPRSALDDDDFPAQIHDATRFPGLYFIGLPWLPTPKAGLFLGVGEEATRVANMILSGSEGDQATVYERRI